MNDDDRIFLTPKEAKRLLNEGDTIHVFLNPSNGMLIGADWGRTEVMELLNSADTIELGGEQCMRMKHGLVAWKNKKPHFIESVAYREEIDGNGEG